MLESPDRYVLRAVKGHAPRGGGLSRVPSRPLSDPYAGLATDQRRWADSAVLCDCIRAAAGKYTFLHFSSMRGVRSLLGIAEDRAEMWEMIVVEAWQPGNGLVLWLCWHVLPGRKSLWCSLQRSHEEVFLQGWPPLRCRLTRRTADEFKTKELLRDGGWRREALRSHAECTQWDQERERGGGSCLKHTFFKFHQLASLETFGGST